jgi:hypothetical protein
VHEKIFTIRTFIDSAKSNISLEKSLLNIKSKRTTTGEINISLPFATNKNLFALIKPREIKVSLDNGTSLTTEGNKYGVYGSLQTTRRFQELVLKAGLRGNYKQLDYDFRIKSNVN